ncbi:MAG TPA: SDR family oxidoreductase [bacterium]
MKDIKGKIVLITGGAMGIGREFAIRFALDGARIVLVDINKDSLDKTVKELKDSGADAYSYICDVTNRKNVYEMAERVKKEVGTVDIIVNNAGVLFGYDFLECPDELLQKTVDVNLNGIMWVTKAFLPDIVAKKKGHIINMASAAGIIGVPRLAVYSATKHAVIGLSESIRLEMKKKNLNDIKFTIVCPSYVDTGMVKGVKAPLGTKLLDTKTVVDKAYKAMKKGNLFVRLPLMVKLTPLLKAITPVSVFEKVSSLLKIDKSMDSWKGYG